MVYPPSLTPCLPFLALLFCSWSAATKPAVTAEKIAYEKKRQSHEKHGKDYKIYKKNSGLRIFTTLTDLRDFVSCRKTKKISLFKDHKR